MNMLELVNIFKNECTYKKINDVSTSKMRNYTNRLQLMDIFLYKFLYSKKDMTKDRAVSIINNKNGTSFTRQAFESKENNIPLKIYANIFNQIRSYYNSTYNNEVGVKLIAVDGTYNNDSYMNEMLNMGFFDITNNIPLDIKSYGVENKNREISSTMHYIKKNMNIFKGNIIVGDRGYFSYEFINFLIKNDLKFIIRSKGDAKNLDPKNKVSHYLVNYDTIINIRNNVRIVKYNNIIVKTIFTSNKKKSSTKHSLEVKNNCFIVTNLLDEKTYNDPKILEIYRSRWDIEVFFKYIKCNYKFQHIKERSNKKDQKIKDQKMYLCQLIISYIAKIIEKYYIKHFPIKNNKKGIISKINKSNIVNGIFDSLIFNILNGQLTNETLNKFCKSYIKIVENKIDRTFPRTSKTPFTKWYIKGYSNQTKYMKVIEAIINNTINDLNKNLKTLAKQIISIDGKKYE